MEISWKIYKLVEKTQEAIMENCKTLGEFNEAAEGIIQVINANMLRAIKLVSVQKGYDPREFSLISFGGAGGLHAAKLAQELGIPKVIVPFSPGTFAAMGQILADIKHDFVFTHLQDPEQLDCADLNQIFHKLEQSGISQLKAEGVPEDKWMLIRSCDIRYLGQAYELNADSSNCITKGSK
jgi:N-methylhydantoinase A